MAVITIPGMFPTGDHASRPAASAVGVGSIYSCTTHGLLYQSDGSSWTTWATLGGGDLDTIITASAGEDIADALAGAAAPDSGNVFATMADVGGGGGGSVSAVSQDISADFTTASDSAWHNITGLTGISLTAGTWIGMFDIEPEGPSTVSFGPVFRIWDGTTTYAQGGYLVTTPAGAISSHYFLASKPFVLGGSATMACAVFSDTAFTIKKFPTRGGLSSAIATHVTFIKIA